jgi:glycosyltransferase involved in cell wall biosynthesis
LINFAEPFGLSLVEAMACGTPVIAYGRGSIPELIKHGETGFMVKDIDEAAAAVHAIDQLDRPRIRRHVEENFSRERMVEEYIHAYQEVLQRHCLNLP